MRARFLDHGVWISLHLRRQINQCLFKALYLHRDGSVEHIELTESFTQLLADDLLSSVSAQATLTGEPADEQNDTPVDTANRARPSTVLRTVITGDQAHKTPQQDLLGRGLHNVRLVPPVGVEPTLGSWLPKI